MNTLDRMPMRAAAWLAAAVLMTGMAALPARAHTFKFANQGDALSMDPHSLNESLQLSYAPELNKRLAYDPEASKKLLADAGYPAGFEVGLRLGPARRQLHAAEVGLA